MGLTTLQVSTTALESNAPNDSTYTQLENALQNITNVRNAIASQMIAILEAAEFGGGNANAPMFNHAHIQQLIGKGNALLNQAKTLVK